MAYIYNNNDITHGCFSIGDTQYPANWLEYSTQDERDALGIIWIDDPPPTQDEIIASLTAVLEAEYDAVAKQERYDNRYTCALRAGYPGPFQQQGIAFALWMDNCNAQAYQIMEDVLAGNRGIPTAEELLTEVFAAWPKPW